jgi:hypothetical protein
MTKQNANHPEQVCKFQTLAKPNKKPPKNNKSHNNRIPH